MFCDAEVRREAELTLVEEYYKTLMGHMNNNGRTVEFGTEQVSELKHVSAASESGQAWMSRALNG